MSRLLRSIIVAVIVLAIVVVGIVQLTRPIPPVAMKTNVKQVSIPGKLSPVFPSQGEAAIGEESLGVIQETKSEQPVPIASLTKMMTAYLLLQAKPLKVGENGPTTTITQHDVQVYNKDVANGDSVLKVQVGEKLTERQLLEGLLLPSGDNIATLIGEQLSGSLSKFVAKMNATAKSLGMTNTHYTDASGVSPATVSTAHDQILIAQQDMKNPVFRKIVAMPQATFPVAGVQYNVDYMLGKNGITGIKTGSTNQAGGCFVSSMPITVKGQQHILIGAVLGQKTYRSLRSAFNNNVKMLDSVKSKFENYTIHNPSQGFAKLTTAWKQSASLKMAKPLTVFGYPGMPVKFGYDLHSKQVPMKAGSSPAKMTVQTGDVTQTIPLQTSAAITKPKLLWKLRR
ncbi:D-alanyl-D-alanine carboxypeptidase family protein [Alicyclobacillus sp. SO9]|uniref:D-alanyl-D-alanine carboxypeptidase family protein n=1 Tax=Alicyclobacillus sp. SO9 TaxID=2665646 RepID=UPI0018E89936|nr:serine hydrolase [Alicyclobacillus sp. SO9]QQE78966.1 D-alanyl-D-alanine carboxypeptidase [Alicyclobacillus sp. SO9]